MSRPAIVVAASTMLATLWASRASKLLLGATVIVGLGAALATTVGWVSPLTLAALRWGLMVPGLALVAVLVSELALRDGLTTRTILYTLLGPVPRFTLALVRTSMAALVLAVPMAGLMLLLRWLGDMPLAGVGRELAAVTLGAACYVGLCGLLHLWTRHGLVAGLAFVLVADYPLARLPFAIRSLAPAAHVSTIGDASIVDTHGLPLSTAAISPMVSVIVLALLAVLSTLVTAWRFSRMDLEELC
jgi:hypothetical protein